jgi:hypothetical protein
VLKRSNASVGTVIVAIPRSTIALGVADPLYAVL